MNATSAVVPRPRRAPGPRGLRSLVRVLGDPLGEMQRIAREHGPVARVPIGARVNHLVTHPDHVRRVLVDGAARYGKGRTFEKTRGYLGDGLATSAGDRWRRQRRLMQPHFHRESVRALGPLITSTIGETVTRWEERAARGELFDAWPDMMSMALHVTTRALFGATLDREVDPIVRSFEIALDHTTRRVLSPVEVPAWLPTRANRRFARAIATLDEIVRRMIAARQADPGAVDLLAMLLGATDEDGRGMTAGELRDEVMTLLLGGHETTGNALAWAWYLLARNPEADAAMRAEVAALGGKPPGMEDLGRLPYTAMVLDETMRLYPQNWVMSRDAVEEDEIGGYAVPAGSTVFLGVFVVHRDPAWWDDPTAFEPRRFEPDAARGRHPFAYVPFGAGQRKCIGAGFARMEGTLALASLAQRFRIELAPGAEVAPLPRFALRPRGGVPVRVTAL